MNYLEIVKQGIINNRVFLKEYFSRQQKLAKRDQFIGKKEFYSRCMATVTELRNKVEFQYYDAINKLAMIQDQLESQPSKKNLKRFDDLKEYEEHIKSKDRKIRVEGFPFSLSINDIDYLEDSLSATMEEYDESNIDVKKKLIDSEKKDSKLTLKEIALIHVYLEKNITKENANEIAQKYGYKSGHKLYQNFNFFYSVGDRKAKPFPFTHAKLKNKIKLFEKVIMLLPEDKSQRALDELQMLKNHEIELE